MKKILITGGCGFIGSNIAVELAMDGFEITCFDNLSRRGSEILLSRVLEYGCSFIHGDIRNAEDLSKLRDDFDLMIECSAEPSVLVGTNGGDASFLINNNLIGSINCFEYCRTSKTPIIFLSTSRVYPYDKINGLNFIESQTRFNYVDNCHGISENGIQKVFSLEGYRSLYGATKLSSEIILTEYSKNYNLPSIINRCGVIAGPWQLGKVDQGVFTYWLVNHFYKKELTYIGFGGQGKQVRDLLHVTDFIELIKIQIKEINNHYGNIYNVGGGAYSNLSLAETTVICQTITGNYVGINSEIKNRPADMIWYITDIDYVKNKFNWAPKKSAFEIIQNIYEWLSKNEKQINKLFE